MWMIAIGHAFAHEWQTMQRSSEKPNIPRKRSFGTGLTSGYWIVALRLKKNRPVTPSPCASSTGTTDARKPQKLIAGLRAAARQAPPPSG